MKCIKKIEIYLNCRKKHVVCCVSVPGSEAVLGVVDPMLGGDGRELLTGFSLDRSALITCGMAVGSKPLREILN